MPTVAELIRDHAEMDVIYEDGGKVHVAYRPRLVTVDWQNQINAAEERGDGPDKTLFAPLRDVVTSWDLQQPDGTEYPMTDEALATIPRHILNQILFSIMTTARPNQGRLPVLSIGGLSARSNLTTISPDKF